MTAGQHEPYLTAGEVAARTSMTPATVREWARTGVITGYRPGGREWLFLWSEVRDDIAKSRHVPPRETEPVRERPKRPLQVVPLAGGKRPPLREAVRQLMAQQQTAR